MGLVWRSGKASDWLHRGKSCLGSKPTRELVATKLDLNLTLTRTRTLTLILIPILFLILILILILILRNSTLS